MINAVTEYLESSYHNSKLKLDSNDINKQVNIYNKFTLNELLEGFIEYVHENDIIELYVNLNVSVNWYINLLTTMDFRFSNFYLIDDVIYWKVYKVK